MMLDFQSFVKFMMVWQQDALSNCLGNLTLAWHSGTRHPTLSMLEAMSGSCQSGALTGKREMIDTPVSYSLGFKSVWNGSRR